ncbi:hypothetical protein DFH08DRAFT_827429 [Mycena albidolilacea]|uniref:Uncharacterized protein n=1 Tax=Mycena albidolilacea TaxID=1033008 RepID=A0AAD7E858_9AGAR|nr:hypothetical protein DFH08DRAFT_827429 [Mycena albidolilacea]
MDRRAPYTARPAAGASWFLLARLAVLLQGLLALFWFLGWFSLDGMDWILAGFGFGLDMLVWWIQKKCWKENQWRRFEGFRNTLGGTLAVPHYHQYFIRALTHRHSTLITWIAACVYFAWSPDLVRIGFLVILGSAAPDSASMPLGAVPRNHPLRQIYFVMFTFTVRDVHSSNPVAACHPSRCSLSTASVVIGGSHLDTARSRLFGTAPCTNLTPGIRAVRDSTGSDW